MPVSYQVGMTTRATIDLHAEWWSPKRTQDGTINTPEVGPDDEGRYVERVVVYAQRYGFDDEWIQAKGLDALDIKDYKKKKLDPMQAAKSPRYLLQRMVVEVTDAKGVPQVKTVQGDNGPMYSGSFFANMPSRDKDWITEELNAMVEPPVRVIDADVQLAAKREERHQHLTVVQQFSEDHPAVQHLAVREVEDVAAERFHPDGREPVYGGAAE